MAFDEKVKETNSREAAWKWFVKYFKEKILREQLIEYKQNLVERDQWRQKGVFIVGDGRTWIVDPSQALHEPESCN